FRAWQGSKKTSKRLLLRGEMRSSPRSTCRPALPRLEVLEDRVLFATDLLLGGQTLDQFQNNIGVATYRLDTQLGNQGVGWSQLPAQPSNSFVAAGIGVAADGSKLFAFHDSTISTLYQVNPTIGQSALVWSSSSAGQISAIAGSPAGDVFVAVKF